MESLVTKLSDNVRKQIAAVARQGNYALLDFPDYSNVGDSAIWLGEIALLSDIYGHGPAYVCRVENIDLDNLDAAVPEGTIFINGGGNLGDLYQKHQDFRQMIFERYGPRVVQLPQSIHFVDQTDMSPFRRMAQTGGILMVRDQPSLAFAEAHGFAPILTPDCAFGLGPLQRPTKPVQDWLILKRSDIESTFAMAGVDWIIEPDSTKTVAKLISIAKHGVPNRLQFYNALAQVRLNRGLKLLCQGQRVATDRLHAHILSLMLGIPHWTTDNSTGKITAFIKTWTNESSLVNTSTNLMEICGDPRHNG